MMADREEIAALVDPFARMLGEIASPERVRGFEAGEGHAAAWAALAGSGYLDAAVAEAHGGAGLSGLALAALIGAIGGHAVPLPIAETIAARALLAAAGHTAPEGAIALATSLGAEQVVPGGLAASHVLLDSGDGLALVETAALTPAPTGVAGSLAARIARPAALPPGPCLPRPEGGLRPLAAALRAALIAGAGARLLAITTDYANARVQFGKPIGRQQALQQLLATMAEEAVATRIAAQLALAQGLPPAPHRAAMAKATASLAAERIAAGAHAVHGAIGISAECDVQLFTRRLHEWRLADGSEGYWQRQLGAARLADPVPSVDWVRAELSP